VATAVQGAILDSHSLSERFRPFPHVVWARQADATVLLDVERGLYYTLNEVAGRAWELLTAGEPLMEILHVLGNEYEVSDVMLQTDMAALLTRLLDAGLLEKVAP
jgi:hypothetical protein